MPGGNVIVVLLSLLRYWSDVCGEHVRDFEAARGSDKNVFYTGDIIGWAVTCSIEPAARENQDGALVGGVELFLNPITREEYLDSLLRDYP